VGRNASAEGARARAALRSLGTLALSTTPVKIRQNVRAIALDEEPGDGLFVQHRLHPQSADDRLLASYFGFVQGKPEKHVMVLSADSGLTTKARSRRIGIVAPAEALELPDDPDEIVRELEKTRRELAEMNSTAPDLRLTFGEGQTHGRFEVQFVKALDDGTREGLLKAWTKRYPHIRPTNEVLEIGGQSLSLGSLAGFPGYVSETDAAEHNTRVDRVFKQYEAFLEAWPAIVNARRRVLTINPVLENSGTAPALDVDVQFWTTAPGLWIDKLPERPKAPGLPKARSLYEVFARVPNLDYLSHIRGPAVQANEDGPNISDGPDQRVQYAIRRVMHHVPCELPAVYFQFDSDDAVAPFTVNVQLVAANIRKPTTSALHVEMLRPEPVLPPAPPEPEGEKE
jgi:hypothetical protein